MFARSIFKITGYVITIWNTVLGINHIRLRQGFDDTTINFLARPHVWPRLQELRMPDLPALDLTAVLQSNKRFVSVSSEYLYLYVSYG